MSRHAPPPPPSSQQVMTEIRAIYAELEKRQKPRDCQLRTECCRFHLSGKQPLLTLGEAHLLAHGIRAAGRTQVPQPPVSGDCPFFQERTGKCAVYEHRPFGCRTHFCSLAGGTCKRSDILDLIRRLEQIDIALGGNGPHEIVAAATSALSEWGNQKHRF